MKNIFILFTLLAIVSNANSQSISRKVVSSAGSTLTGGSSQISFSIGETVIPSLSSGAAMITQGFEQPGEQIRTGSVSAVVCAGSSFNLAYTATDIGGGNSFTAQLSNAAGSFASPVNIGTLSGNASAGVINVTIPANTTAGTGYRIRITSSSPAFIGTNNGANIKINAAPMASISYGSGSFCKTGSVSVTRTGQSGGTYSATPSGLSINSSTGAINLAASTANTYTVKYSFSNSSCSNTATAMVTVNAVPSVPSVAAQRFCGPTTVASLPNGGGTYKWYSSNSSSTPLASSTALSTQNYYVSNASGSCESARASVSVTVNSVPTASITYNGYTFCKSGNVNVSRSGQSGGSYSASPSGLSINSSSGKINLGSSATGRYTITYSFSNGSCSNTTTTTINVIYCNNNDDKNAIVLNTNSTDFPQKESLLVDKFDVVAYPNPSAYQFNLVVQSSSNEKIDITVYDLSGKLLKHLVRNKDEFIIFGAELPRGVYIATITQGVDKKTIKLIKK